MHKISVVKVVTLLILVSFCCQLVNTQLSYEEQICPLSRYNIKVAEDLMKTSQELLEEIREQGLDTSEEEALLNEANQLLQKARMFSTYSSNCTAGNFYAIKAQNLLRKAKKMFESRLDTIRDEEYSVYAAFIDTGFYLIKYRYNRDEVQLIVIDDYTLGCKTGSDLKRTLEWVAEELPAVEQETLDNFRIKNTQSHPLENRFNLTVNVVLISVEEASKIFQKGGWEGFYEEYPFSQGVMTLSRVGFNPEMDQALLYVANEADDSIGGGYYILFTEEDGVWTIQEWVIAWVY